MSQSAQIPALKRLAYFSGQRLTAADLTDADEAAREMRWLHNRSLHGWGVATGFQVSGSRGDRAVTVSPGYGIDCLGREIILSRETVENVPAVNSRGAEVLYYVVASWLDDSRERVLESRAGACSGKGAVRLSDEPLIAWRSPAALQEGLELILSEVWIQNCQISRAPSAASRRNVKPSQQPYISSGQTDPDNTIWSLWISGQQVIGVQTDVDTSDARFGSAPQYFARMGGDRHLPAPPGPLLAVGFAAAVNPRSDGFTLRVMFPPGAGIVNPPVLHNLAQAQQVAKLLNWHVVWMGIED